MTTAYHRLLIRVLPALLLLPGCNKDKGMDPDIAPTSATYQVTFGAVWSAQTHPQDFPSGAHFSDLFGAVHNAQASFWGEGKPASPGIKDMAELGSTATLLGEIVAAGLQGNIDSPVQGGGIDVSPGSVQVVLTLSHTYPLVTLVSMLAPSPDWFIGVNGLDLRDDDEWPDMVTVNLFPYDAGTDSGDTYTAPNNPTSPPGSISMITSGVLEVNGSVPAVGQFIFEKQ